MKLKDLVRSGVHSTRDISFLLKSPKINKYFMHFWSDSSQGKFIQLASARLIIQNTKNCGFRKRKQEIERFVSNWASFDKRRFGSIEKHKNKNISWTFGQIPLRQSLYDWFQINSSFGIRKKKRIQLKEQGKLKYYVRFEVQSRKKSRVK